MAEAPPTGFHNKRLLLVAALIGVVFLVLLNMQRVMDSRRLQRNRVEFVLATADLAPGQVLTSSNVEAVALPREVASKAKGLYPFDRVELGETRVQRFVAKNDLLRLTDMEERLANEDALSKRMRGDRQVISLVVGGRTGSAFVKSGARVDLWGAIRDAGASARVQSIIENLEVLSVDGEVDFDKQREKFRTVEVHVPTELVADLKEIQRRAVEPLSISIRRPGDLAMKHPYDPNRPDMGGAINPAVRKGLSRPFVTPSRGGPADGAPLYER